MTAAAAAAGDSDSAGVTPVSKTSYSDRATLAA